MHRMLLLHVLLYAYNLTTCSFWVSMIMAFRYLEAYISESEGDFRWVNMYIILPPPKKNTSGMAYFFVH